MNLRILQESFWYLCNPSSKRLEKNPLYSDMSALIMKTYPTFGYQMKTILVKLRKLSFPSAQTPCFTLLAKNSSHCWIHFLKSSFFIMICLDEFPDLQAVSDCCLYLPIQIKMNVTGQLIMISKMVFEFFFLAVGRPLSRKFGIYFEGRKFSFF